MGPSRAGRLHNRSQGVGAVANAHTHALRGEVEPRFFVPAEQRPLLGTDRMFLIRTDPNPLP